MPKLFRIRRGFVMALAVLLAGGLISPFWIEREIAHAEAALGADRVEDARKHHQRLCFLRDTPLLPVMTRARLYGIESDLLLLNGEPEGALELVRKELELVGIPPTEAGDEAMEKALERLVAGRSDLEEFRRGYAAHMLSPPVLRDDSPLRYEPREPVSDENNGWLILRNLANPNPPPEFPISDALSDWEESPGEIENLAGIVGRHAQELDALHEAAKKPTWQCAGDVLDPAMAGFARLLVVEFVVRCDEGRFEEAGRSLASLGWILQGIDQEPGFVYHALGLALRQEVLSAIEASLSHFGERLSPRLVETLAKFLVQQIPDKTSVVRMVRYEYANAVRVAATSRLNSAQPQKRQFASLLNNKLINQCDASLQRLERGEPINQKDRLRINRKVVAANQWIRRLLFDRKPPTYVEGEAAACALLDLSTETVAAIGEMNFGSPVENLAALKADYDALAAQLARNALAGAPD